MAEVTLALVLFTDASRVNVHELRHDVGLPVRLLAVGLPLTIGFGTAVAFGIVPGVSLWVAATIGAIVAPTDAALGATIMEDTRIPNRVRRLLNVESGLNDGIATPFVNLFLAGAVTTEVIHSTSVLGAAADLLVGAGGRRRGRTGRRLGAGPGQRRRVERSGLPDPGRPGPGPAAPTAPPSRPTATGSSPHSSPGWPSVRWCVGTSRRWSTSPRRPEGCCR